MNSIFNIKKVYYFFYYYFIIFFIHIDIKDIN